jgi:hypothetical protein
MTNQLVLRKFCSALSVLPECFDSLTLNKKVARADWGLETYYDRTGICLRAILVLFIGAMALTVGFFYQA